MNSPAVKSLVIFPTYNEIENLPLIVARLRAAQPEADILVVDDNSPDGTGAKADELAAEDTAIHVLHRSEKTGLLGAYLAGFKWGLEREYDVFVQMDADGSHAPEELHLLLDEIADGADMVIGSRYVDGGTVVDWSADRLALSKGGNAYIGLMLGTGLSDMTAGYRAIRREVLETVDLDELSTKGYIFQVDFARRAVHADFDVREVPITFSEREHGESKLDGSFVKDSLGDVTRWGLQYRGAQATNLAEQLVGLAKFEYGRSSLPGLGDKVKGLVDDGKGLAGEMLGLLRFEAKRAGLIK